MRPVQALCRRLKQEPWAAYLHPCVSQDGYEVTDPGVLYLATRRRHICILSPQLSGARDYTVVSDLDDAAIWRRLASSGVPDIKTLCSRIS